MTKTKVYAPMFQRDVVSQMHAKRWATRQYGEQHAQTFLLWLMDLTPAEQHEVWVEGFRVIKERFEQDHGEVLR